MELERGDIIIFRGHGLVFSVLSKMLSIFDKKWRRLQYKVWHVAFISGKVLNLYTIGESVNKGVTEAWLNENADFKVYRWLDKEPPRYKIQKFLLDRAYSRYDLAIYLWTMLFYLVRHYFNRPIPKLLDNHYSCWELVGEFCAEMGKPIVSKYDTFFITDMLKVLSPYQVTRDG